jgi:hypothetical protein
MERFKPLRSGGAKSPTRGIMSWGVTVVTPQMNESARNAVNEGVTQRPIHCEIISRLAQSWPPSHTWATYKSCRESNERDDKHPPLQHIPEWENKDEASGIASL